MRRRWTKRARQWRKQAVEWLDEAALAKLPAAKRESCRALWRDVERLANQAAGEHSGWLTVGVL